MVIATQNIVDEPEFRDPDEPAEKSPGKLEDQDMNFPAGEIEQSFFGAEPTSLERIREGSDEESEEKEAERGHNLTDLTKRETPGYNVLNTWLDTPRSYGDPNAEEDPDLHLGSKISRYAYKIAEDMYMLRARNLEVSQLCKSDTYNRYIAEFKSDDFLLDLVQTYVDQFYKKSQKQIWVGVDLDGTILEDPTDEDYRDIVEGDQPSFGNPIPDAAEALGTLIAMGVRVSIYTARFEEGADNERFKAEIADYLESQEIPFSDIYVGIKPRCDLIIDNKVLRFEGDWFETLNTTIDLLNLDQDKEAVAVIDTVDDGNTFNDPWGSRRDLAIPRDIFVETENPFERD
jgi:hypothetical protein